VDDPPKRASVTNVNSDHVAPDSRVARALDHAIELGELGVQVTAYLDGELIVDAWIGTADPASGRQVDASTLFTAFSVTKAVTVTALHLQAERGLVSYDEPVATYWPEFAANGKETITVRDVLSHRSGIPQMPAGVGPEEMCDWGWMTAGIERLTPMFAPGTTNTYQTLVFGWTVGEIVRRTDRRGRSFDRFVREELLDPLAIDDLFFGVPDAELDRVAPVIATAPELAAPKPNADERIESIMPIAVFTGPIWNRLDIRRSVSPGAGAIMSARAAARLFAMLAGRGALGGVRLLSEQRLLWCTVPRDDALAPDPTRPSGAWVGQGGYWLGGQSPPAWPVVGDGQHILCHPGAGGSIGWADLDSGLAVAILHNRMQDAPTFSSTDPGKNPFLELADAVRLVASDRRA
jgi:CubicO group peptidase (beta-lactamase class C family)